MAGCKNNMMDDDVCKDAMHAVCVCKDAMHAVGVCKDAMHVACGGRTYMRLHKDPTGGHNHPNNDTHHKACGNVQESNVFFHLI